MREQWRIWRKETGEEVVVKPREPEVVYDAYSPDNHYLGLMSEAQLRRNGFSEFSEAPEKEE